MASEGKMHPYDIDHYRFRVIYGLSLATMLVLLPFAVNNFLQGRVALGSAVALLVIVFAVSAVGIHRTGRPPLSPVFMFLPVIAGLAMSVYTQGIPGILWSFPALVLFSFIFLRRTANIMSAVLVATIAPIAYVNLGLPLTIRVVVTLSLVIVFGNIFSRIVDSLRLQLEQQATLDPLTGAFNRRQLDASLESASERCRRHKVTATLLALDLDHFKRINDDLGHQVGDRVLQDIVKVIQGRVRQLDLVFRTGGEEFLVLLSETDRDGAVRVAEDLRVVIAGAPLLPDRRVTVSVGVAPFVDADDRDGWLRRADDALYAAKAKGRDRVEVG